MDQSDYVRLRASTEMDDHSGILQEILNLTENLDCYEICHDIKDYDDLERYCIEELDAIQVPKYLKNYIDYESYGQDIAIDENGTFIYNVYVWDTGSSFHEFYDGEYSSIPDVYRVMTFRNELPQKGKSELPMDIAFDMDYYFRQRDPHRAAEHSEEQDAKEEICENLMQAAFPLWTKSW